MPLFRACAAFLLIGLVSPLLTAESELLTRADSVLQEVAEREQGWIKVHAADVLVALGQTKRARAVFSAESDDAWRTAPHRVGLLRTFAQTTDDAAERETWVERIEQLALTPDGADRLQAIETLAKLGHPLQGDARATLRAYAASHPAAEAAFAWWALTPSDPTVATAQLVRQLGAREPLARLRSAYALNRIQPDDDAARAAVAVAAQNEPADSVGYAYVVSAALQLNPEHALAPQWHAALEEVLHTGAPNARYEAAQALMRRFSKEDLKQVEPLLAHAHGDVRLAAAWTIQHVLRR